MASLSSSSSSSSQRDLFTEVFTGELIRVLIEFLNIHVFDLGYTKVQPLSYQRNNPESDPRYYYVLSDPRPLKEGEIRVTDPGCEERIISLDDNGLSCRRSLWGLNRSLRSCLDSPRFDKFSQDHLAYRQWIKEISLYPIQDEPSFLITMRNRSQLHRDEQEPGDYETRPLYNPSLPPHPQEISCPLIKPNPLSGALEKAWLEHSRRFCDSDATVVYYEKLFKVHLLLLLSTNKTKRWSVQQEGADLWGDRCTLDILFHMSINKSLFKFSAGDTTTSMFLHTAVLVFYRIFGLQLTLDIIDLLWRVADYKGYIHAEGEIVGMNQMIRIFKDYDYYEQQEWSFTAWAFDTGLLATCWNNTPEVYELMAASLNTLTHRNQIDSMYTGLSLQWYFYGKEDLEGDWLYRRLPTHPSCFIINDAGNTLTFLQVQCLYCTQLYPWATYWKDCYSDPGLNRQCPHCKTTVPFVMEDRHDRKHVARIVEDSEKYHSYKIDLYDGAVGYWYEGRIHYFPINNNREPRFVKNDKGLFVTVDIETETHKDRKPKRRRLQLSSQEEEEEEEEEKKSHQDGRMA